MIENDKTVTVIDSQGFRFTVYIYNGQDKPTPLNKAVIKSLVIEEAVKDWFIKGFIIIEDRFNTLQRPWTSEREAPEGVLYKFRNDGNDSLLISVQPVLDGQPQDALKPEVWNLELSLAIYDVQDFSFGDETALKYKKLYFWERDYQTFIESKISWSTANLVENAANLTDRNRRVFTGDALRDLITTALGPTQTFNEEWDTGSSKLFYTSSSKNTIQDDLIYLYKSHVSSFKGGNTGDFCILSRNRYNKQWNLEPLNSIFGKAVANNKPGPYQLEHFFIGGNTQELEGQVQSISPYKTPINKDAISLETNVHLGQYSTIEGYQFVDMAAIDNVKVLNSTPVYHNNTLIHQFDMDFENHDIENVKEYIQTNYANKLRHTIKPEVLLTLNKNKIEARVVDPVYSFGKTGTDRLANGQNTILMSSLFLNQCIVFTVQGMTHRTANRFIGIDRIFGETENDFDNRLLGQWYVINCKHIFIEDRYVNEMTCVKVHSCDTRNLDDNL
jgi:hypothetical protein